jgi:hypothetical protein
MDQFSFWAVVGMAVIGQAGACLYRLKAIFHQYGASGGGDRLFHRLFADGICHYER